MRVAFLDQPSFFATTLDEFQQPADSTGWVQKPHALTARLPGLDEAADATGYLVIVENVVRGLRPEWTPWRLSNNAGM